MTPAPRRQGKPARVGSVSRPDVLRRLELAGMDPDDARRVLDAADVSLDPVPDPSLPWPYIDVYARKIGPGYTLGVATGPRSPA